MRGRNISTNFFLYSLLSPSISSSFSTLSSLSPLPFLLHRSTPCLSVHLHRRILPSFFFFCFTPLRSLQPVLRQPVIPPLFFWLANCAHTRALEHTKRHLCRFPLSLSLSPSLFSSLSSRPRVVARSTVANCEYAHYRYLQTARTRLLVRAPRLFSFQISTRIDESFDPSFRSRFSLSPLSRLLLPSVVFFAPPPLLLSSVMHRACFEKEGSKSVPFFEL